MTQPPARRLFLPALLVFGMVAFAGLGVWQLERLAWKRDLIARVEARVDAPPSPLPARAGWGSLSCRNIEYRRVIASGRFLPGADTLVDALTERGAGYWVMTPFLTAQGIVLVNRGFVPKGREEAGNLRVAPGSEPSTVIGLVRLSEPEGRFLRPNQPEAERWFSRDVEAIAKKRELGPVAPFFIDAAASGGAEGLPIGGMTVLRFRNSHLVYAVTWFGLAILCAGGLVLIFRNPHGGS